MDFSVAPGSILTADSSALAAKIHYDERVSAALVTFESPISEREALSDHGIEARILKG